MTGFTEIANELVETHDIDVAVELEPDDTTCGSSWYIASAQVHGLSRKGWQWYDVPERSRLFEEIKGYALMNCGDALAELWDQYCDDHPKRRAPSDYAEHGTYRVPL